jgi:hypothetical protein
LSAITRFAYLITFRTQKAADSASGYTVIFNDEDFICH